MGFWTDDRVGRLHKLISEGVHYRQIARDIGGGCTPGMICGKVDRERRKFPEKFPMRDKTGQISRHDTSRNRLYQSRHLPFATQKRLERLREDAANVEYREALQRMSWESHRGDLQSLENVPDDGCRYIPVDPQETRNVCCGRPAVPGQSWCPEHFSRIMQPQVVRLRPGSSYTVARRLREAEFA
jgi:hypothetical protein